MRTYPTSNLLWFLAGACTGAAIGLLLAPKPGREYVDRGRELYEKGRHLKEDAGRMFEEGRRLMEASYDASHSAGGV